MNYSELRYQPARSKVYLGSPSIIRLPDGVLVASHDYFGNLKNMEGEAGLSSIYRSDDNGQSWSNVTHMIGAFWGTLFLHNNVLYHISISQEYGHVVIRHSDDGGFTWSVPRDEKNGLLFRAGPGRTSPNYHFGGATSVLVHNGRIYKALEDYLDIPNGPDWRPDRFKASVISAPVDADLLDAANWTVSNKILFDYKLLPDKSMAEAGNGWLEGTVVVAPDGNLKMLMRIHLKQPNKAAILSLSDDGKKLEFDYTTGVIDFIGGHSKFTVRRDPITGSYFTLTNYVSDDKFPNSRNTLILAVSDDLYNWRSLETLLSDDTGLEPEQSALSTGFQYPDWQFDGEDIIYLVRASYRGAHNYHDSNRITYHILKNFRSFLK
jgi:BNR repeat-like domain